MAASEVHIESTILAASTAKPIAPSVEQTPLPSTAYDPHEEELWGADEVMIQTMPDHAEADIKRIGKAVAIKHHPGQVVAVGRSITTFVLERASDLLGAGDSRCLNPESQWMRRKSGEETR
jgi:hypothetical protein